MLVWAIESGNFHSFPRTPAQRPPSLVPLSGKYGDSPDVSAARMPGHTVTGTCSGAKMAEKETGNFLHNLSLYFSESLDITLYSVWSF